MFPHLVTEEPHPSLGGHADTYGRLIGSWRGTYRDPNESSEEIGPLEVRFSWALEGRAVQDVWIAPSAPHESTANLRRRTYGTTIRAFDPQAQVWREDWWDPCRGFHCALVGSRSGDDIVQTGSWDDHPQRWRSLDIRADSFTWQAHRLNADGEHWDLQTEFLLKRHG